MLVCVFEDEVTEHLYPLTRTRGSCGLRIGRRTLLDTIRDALPATGVIVHCRQEIEDVVRAETNLSVNRLAEGVDVLFVNARLFPDDGGAIEELLRAASSSEAVVFTRGSAVAAAWMPAATRPHRLVDARFISADTFPGDIRRAPVEWILIDRLWNLLDHIHDATFADFKHLSKGFNVYEGPGADVSPHAVAVNGEHIFLAPGAKVYAGAILDATDGPIIVDLNAKVGENAVVRGPVSIGEHSVVKPGAVIEGSTIGPWCRVAGEVQGSVMHSYSNKAHPGYLGDSYLGSWCNLGAATNTSNLRNDYAAVSVFNEALGEHESSGRIFAGLFMGDHSKCGIAAMFNTGTVIGVSCNLYGSGYQPRYVPSFIWGNPADGFVAYRLPKAIGVARIAMGRRDRELSAAEEDMLERIFSETAPARARGPIK